MITAKRILVPHDFSETSEGARQYAVELAQTFGARLDVLHVSDKTHAELPFASGFLVRPGSPAREIIRVARARDIDLIVMGTHGRGLVARAILGSVAAEVLRTAPCPVLTVRRVERPFRLSNVLIGVDFGPASHVALAYGRSICRTFGARLHLLHAIENYFLRPMVGDPRVIAERAEERLTDVLIEDDFSSLRANPIVEVSDAPAEAILACSAQNAIDLIIVGTHGRPTMERLLMGSVAERVVRTAPCPVLTVHLPDRHFVKRGVLAAKVRSMMTAVSDGQRQTSANA